MSEIPKDIQKIAEEIVIYGPIEDRGVTCSLIAKAILAERERCANIAEDYALDDQPNSAYTLACSDIAIAIREAKP